MIETLMALGIVAEIALVAAAVYAIRVFSRLGGAVDRVAERLDADLKVVSERTEQAMAEVGQTAREVRSRSEQMGRVLREAEAIAAALGVLVGTRELVGPTFSSLVGSGIKKLSSWLTKLKPQEGESQ